MIMFFKVNHKESHKSTANQQMYPKVMLAVMPLYQVTKQVYLEEGIRGRCILSS